MRLRHIQSRWGWFMAVVGLVFLPPILRSMELDYSSKAKGNITVFANDLGSADLLAMEADEVCGRFDQLLGSNARKSRVPIILVFKESQKNDRDCFIQVFRNEGGFKIQAEWPSLPISNEAFVRGCVRSLCLRFAIEKKGQSLRSLAKETETLFVPFWISEGISMLVGGETLRTEALGRTRLIAGMEPNMSLEEVTSELGGKDDLNPGQQALAASLCQFLLSMPTMAANFCSSFHFQKNTQLYPSIIQWSALSQEKLNAAWETYWARQAMQFTAEKLGYRYMLQWIIDLENKGEICIKNKKNNSERTMDWNSAVNPWFQSWILGRASDQDPESLEKEMIKLRKDIQVRRSISLDWLGRLENQTYPTRSEVLLWNKIRRSGVLPVSGESSGDISKWFDSISH